MKNDIRFVPIQQLCLLCSAELPASGPTHGLAARLCRACILLLGEQMYVRELESHPKMKIVRIS
jgi:hypothetical protein